MSLDQSMEALIEQLGLIDHPEGGYFRETFRSPITLHQQSDERSRAASTAIYFLLTADTFSAFHMVKGLDEVWHHYIGEPVELHLLSETLGYRTQVLGIDLEIGQRPQIVVPAGTFQAARTIGDRYSLCGCTVAPGFDFADWDMPDRESLLRQFPEHADVIARFTRE